MNRFIRMIPVLVLVLLPVLHVSAQGTRIEYGATAAGEITNTNFEVLFTFDGSAGDVVLIEMIAENTGSLDPYLYLTTLQNEVLAQNDDYYNFNSRIVSRLPQAATYQIVATRNGGRSGSGEGAFTLRLNSTPPAKIGITLEGQTTTGGISPTHVFVPPAAGIYTVTYTHVTGDFYPGLVISKLQDGQQYEEEAATISGANLRAASVTIEFQLDAIYILTVRDTTYSYFPSDAFADYTLQITAAE